MVVVGDIISRKDFISFGKIKPMVFSARELKIITKKFCRIENSLYI